jgi:hypothetical protein
MRKIGPIPLARIIEFPVITMSTKIAAPEVGNGRCYANT